MAIQDPRFHTLSATTGFNGSTVLPAAPWLPENNPNSGRVSASGALVGRVSWKNQLRDGTIGALVLARSLTGDSTVVTLRQRSASSAEIAELPPKMVTPAPVNTDVLLRTVQLTSEWSAPLLLAPTDALTYTGANQAQAGTVEWQNFDLSSAGDLAWIQGVLQAGGGDDCCSSDSVTVTETGTLSAWGTSVRFVFVNAPAGSIITYPLLAAISLDQRLVFVRIGGGVVFIVPSAGEQQNGQADGVVELDGFTAVTVTRREATWATSKQVLSSGQSLSIAVADTTVAIAAARAPQEAVRIETIAAGYARLPLLAASAVGDEFQIVRNGGAFQICIIPQAGESLNGEVNGKIYLGFNDAAVARKTLFGWLVTTDTFSRQAKTLTTAANVTLDRWGGGLLIVQATGGAGQTLTLPANTADVCFGAAVMFGCQGAGGLTINGNGSNIRSGTGAPAATMALAQHENAYLLWDGVVWTAILGT